MTSRARILTAAIFALSVLAYLARADDAKVRIVIESSLTQFEPAFVRLRIRVEPDPANRALILALISDGFETSSLEQLAGSSAPITRWWQVKGVPAGEYQIVAEVYRPSAKNWRAQQALTVLGVP